MSSAASSQRHAMDDFGGGKGRGLLNPVISASCSEETDDDGSTAASNNQSLEAMFDRLTCQYDEDQEGPGVASAASQVTDDDLAEQLKRRLNLDRDVDDKIYLKLAEVFKTFQINADAPKENESARSGEHREKEQQQKENSNDKKKDTVPLGDYFSQQNETKNEDEKPSANTKSNNGAEDQDDTVITEPILQSPNFTSPLGGGRRGKSRRGSNPRQRGRSTNRRKTPDVSGWKKAFGGTNTTKDHSLTQSTHGVAFESSRTPPRGLTPTRPSTNNRGRTSPIPPSNSTARKARSPSPWRNLFGAKNAARADSIGTTPVPATPPANPKIPSPPPTGDFPSPLNASNTSNDSLPSFSEPPIKGQAPAMEEEKLFDEKMSNDSNASAQTLQNNDTSVKTGQCKKGRKQGTTPPPPPPPPEAASKPPAASAAHSPIAFNVTLSKRESKRGLKIGTAKQRERRKKKGPKSPSASAAGGNTVPPPAFEQTAPVLDMFPKTAPAAATRFTVPNITPPPPTNVHVASVLSPMEVDTASDCEPKTPSNVQNMPLLFNIGRSDKQASPSSRRLASPSTKGPPSSRLRSRRKQQRATTPGGSLFKNPPAAEHRTTVNTSPSLETAPTAESTSDTSHESNTMDYSGKNELVEHLRAAARQDYINNKFKSSIEIYTQAIDIYKRGVTDVKIDDVRAILHANRAAALLMVGANVSAATDCEEGLQFVSNHNTGASDSGTTLKGKLFARLGKACLRLGQLDKAYNAFDQADAVASNAEAVLGKAEVKRCQEAMEGLKKTDDSGFIPSPFSPDAGARRSKMQALVFVNNALNMAPSDISLHEKKLTILASMKRWREIARHCECLAAETTKMDGVFIGDLAKANPYVGVAPADHLKANFFARKDKQTDMDYEMLKLSREAASEAVLRLPLAMVPYYLRALRLEERYAQAKAANHSLSTHVNTAGTAFYQRDDLASRFAWLSRERDKLNRTISGKDKGDTAFGRRDYRGAAECYGQVLTIDAEGESSPPGDNATVGGRLHAVLYCNRAACFMQVDKYHDAIKECSAALRIHSHYMKAILRRARCYAKLERYQESIGEYKRYVELVEEARKSPGSIPGGNTPCLFENPGDVSKKVEEKTKKELEEVVSKKKQEEENVRRQEEQQRAQQRRQYSETFGGGRRNAEGEAHRRREQWFNQQSDSSRRWDSFNGASPNPKARANAYGRQDGGNNRRQQQQDQYNRSQSSRRAPLGSPGSDKSRDHYSVLEIQRNASATDIKKAYHRMALRYHPDKNSDPSAADTFRRIKLAYETLGDEESKRKYDAEIRWSRMY